MVQRFRTKIVEIEAVRFTGDNVEELRDWTDGQFRLRTIVGATKELLEEGEGKMHFEEYGEVFDDLHDTWIRVTPGQWIVKGAKGEFYPCDDETFHWKYEEVTLPDFTLTGTLEYRDGVVSSEGFEVEAGDRREGETEPQRFDG